MNNFKIYIILSLILILSSCTTVKEGFTNQKKKSSDEFLVEKKSPLVLPPNFKELPIPLNQKADNENQINNFKSLITEKIKNKKIETIDSDKDFEKTILDKIKNN
jgi:PBP1b-binding outer membrane lipoprotein LpoB